MRKSKISFLFVVVLILVFNVAIQPVSAQMTNKIASNDSNAELEVASLKKDIVSNDSIRALAAVDKLAEKGAFDILAQNLETSVPEVSDAIINQLLKAPGDKAIIAALAKYLAKINKPAPLNGGEEIAALNLTKQKIVNGLGRMTGLQTGNIDVKSGEAIDEFLKLVFAKK